jgi:hypothetical protein
MFDRRRLPDRRGSLSFDIELLALDWRPRQQRRTVDRQLRDHVCSACGNSLEHNSRIASGLDARGNVVLAGECCIDRIVETFGLGLVIDRAYDFLPSRSAEAAVAPTSAQIAEGIAACQKLIAGTDKRIPGVERRGGAGLARNVSLLDHPWKEDDRKWFERNPSRAHRLRRAYPGEFPPGYDPPPGHTLIVLLRQVEPGSRLKFDFLIRTSLMSLPDDEAVACALFEAATQREPAPRDRQALCDLIEKYRTPPTARERRH